MAARIKTAKSISIREKPRSAERVERETLLLRVALVGEQRRRWVEVVFVLRAALAREQW
jgi:hypothetical protein